MRRGTPPDSLTALSQEATASLPYWHNHLSNTSLMMLASYLTDVGALVHKAARLAQIEYGGPPDYPTTRAMKRLVALGAEVDMVYRDFISEAYTNWHPDDGTQMFPTHLGDRRLPQQEQEAANVI